MAHAFQKSKSGTVFVDFAWYGPSNEAASFIATPLKNKEGVFIGSAAFQVSLKEINAIMQTRAGMGRNGETYLVGPDKLMRSDSFLDPKGHSVKASFADPSKGSVDTLASREGIAGKTGTDTIIDYTGGMVFSSYTPTKIGGTSWVLIAEIDEAEALESANQLRITLLTIAVIGAILIGAFALFLSRSISVPLVNVAGKLKTMAHGELQQEQVVVKTSDEIGDLGQVFNEMLGGLQNFLKYAGDILAGSIDRENFGLQGDFEKWHSVMIRDLENQPQESPGQRPPHRTKEAWRGDSAKQEHREGKVASDGGNVPQEAEELMTGNKDADEDIMAFFKAKEEMMKRVRGGH